MHRRCCQLAASSVLYTTSRKHCLVLPRMGEIIDRNMLSWLKLLIKLLWLHLVGCLYYCNNLYLCKSYCSTVHFRRITSIYQTTNAHIISHKTLLKHPDMFRSYQIVIRELCSFAKVILHYSQFNSYLQTRCCGSISCCVGMCCGTMARCASYDAHLARNKSPWWWCDKMETCRRVLKCLKVFYLKLYVHSLVDIFMYFFGVVSNDCTPLGWLWYHFIFIMFLTFVFCIPEDDLIIGHNM